MDKYRKVLRRRMYLLTIPMLVSNLVRNFIELHYSLCGF